MTTTTEQFSLRWNNFHSNLTSGFHELLEAADMVDVTLAVDGHFLQAHKIVLSICSPYFKQMFKVNPCTHPIVILKDIGHENMKDILEFMYMGQVSVLRENLTQFLRTAELLQVKGLTGDDSNEESPSNKDIKPECDNEEDNDVYNQLIETDVELPTMYSQPHSAHAPTPNFASGSSGGSATKRLSKSSNGVSHTKRPKSDSHIPKHDYEPIKMKQEHASSNDVIADNIERQIGVGGDLEDNKDVINMKAAWENSFSAASSTDLNSSEHGKSRSSAGSYQCSHCLKKFSRRDHLRTHEKNIHGEYVGPFKCMVCEQMYKNTESLRKHIAKFHFSAVSGSEIHTRVEINV